MTGLIYNRGQLSAERLQQEITQFWAESVSDTELRAALNSAGLDSKELDVDYLSQAITVQVASSGLDPLSVSVVVVLAPTANRVLIDIWKATILPRIKRRWGDDAVGKEVDKRDDAKKS